MLQGTSAQASPVCNVRLRRHTVQQQPLPQRQQQRSRATRLHAAAAANAAAPAAARPASTAADSGHTALLHSLGEVGDVATMHMPWLLRLAHIKSRITGGDSNLALQESARGLLMWKAALERGLVLDDFTISQLIDEKDSFVAGQSSAYCPVPADCGTFTCCVSVSNLAMPQLLSLLACMLAHPAAVPACLPPRSGVAPLAGRAAAPCAGPLLFDTGYVRSCACCCLRPGRLSPLLRASMAASPAWHLSNHRACLRFGQCTTAVCTCTNLQAWPALQRSTQRCLMRCCAACWSCSASTTKLVRRSPVVVFACAQVSTACQIVCLLAHIYGSIHACTMRPSGCRTIAPTRLVLLLLLLLFVLPLQ